MTRREYNLEEAQSCMAKLQPILHWPTRWEKFDPCGLTDDRPKNLPIVEQPTTLISNIGPFVFRKLPSHWHLAYYEYQGRRRRNRQFLHLQNTFPWINQNAELLDVVDSTVAGLLLGHLRPEPGCCRDKLLAQIDWWGAYYALQGTVYSHEADALLAKTSNDPRLAAAAYRENPDLCAPVVAMQAARNDLWSGTIALQQPLAQLWLGRVCEVADRNPLAAVSALVLQPSATAEQKRLWMQRLKTAHPRLAYLAVRWSQTTWPPAEWKQLRDDLRDNAVRDNAQIWFHWHRDIETERLLEVDWVPTTQVLWLAEMIHQLSCSGQEMKRHVTEQLRRDANDPEALLALKWLKRRGRKYD